MSIKPYTGVYDVKQDVFMEEVHSWLDTQLLLRSYHSY